MEAIREALRALEEAKEQLRETVQQARRDGHTWAEIGAALGMTRQAAFKRFGHVTNPTTNQTMTGAPMSIDQVQRATEQVFDLMSAGDFDKIEERIHPDVRQDLPASLISETWTAVLKEFGALESYSDTHVVMPAGERIMEDEEILGTVVGVTTLNHEAGEMMGRVAVDEQLRVVGLLIAPPDHSPLPF